MRKPMILGATALAVVVALSGCGNDATTASPSTVTTVVVAPTPTPTAVTYNVQPCLDQIAVPGQTVQQLIIPDTVHIDLGQPSGFPNGRRFDDPVVDVTLAVLLLDMTKHSPATLANVPLNPGGNIEKVSNTFPYLAPPEGMTTTAPTVTSGFNFRTDPDSAFVRVDRMGMPAVATALIGSTQKNPYNDANPSDDVAGKYIDNIRATLTTLHNQLGDDLLRLGLTTCAKPN